MSTLKLSRSIMINGKQYAELSYDFDAMTAKDITEAGKAIKMAEIPFTVGELDPDYQLYLFAQAVCCANKDIAISDVLRMSAKDAVKAAGLARDFFYFGSEDLSPKESSDDTSLLSQ